MVDLHDRDVQALLELVGDMYGARTLEEFRQALFPALRRVAPADFVSYNEVLGGDRVIAAIAEPAVPEEALAVWDRHLGENPILEHYLRTRDGRAYRFSDFVTPAELHRRTLYQAFYRPLGIEHQIAFTLPAPAHLTVAIALSRGRPDFSAREQTVLNLARPHLIQAYRNAQLHEHAARMLDAARDGLTMTGTALIALDAEGIVVLATPAARALADDLGGPRLAEGEALHGPLARARAGEWALRGPSGEPVAVLTKRLNTPDGLDLVVLERGSSRLRAERLAELGLSRREAEVLALLAGAASTVEIASRLGIGRRTVHKHIENIHRKLGVSGRAQAIATAWAAISAADELEP